MQTGLIKQEGIYLNSEIMISLTSIQWQDKEKCETELITRAEFSMDNGCCVIKYNDTEATGFEGSVTTIRVDDNKNASITREGTANSLLSLETGKKHFCQYGTPFGNMQIGVFTHQICNNLCDNGVLYLKYTIDLNSSYLSDNEVILKIKGKNA